MQLLMCVINEAEKLNPAIEALAKLGIPGATVVESQGMGKILHDVPHFTGFRHLLEGIRPYNYVIFSVLEKEELVDKALEALQGVGSKGVAFSLPVSRFVHLGQQESATARPHA